MSLIDNKTGKPYSFASESNALANETKLGQLMQENERLRKALAFYADEANWEDTGGVYEYNSKAYTDGGDIATEALAALKKE